MAEEVVYSSAVEAKAGFFSLFSQRFWVLNGQELRWFDKFEDFDNNFPPEKSLQLPAITSIVSGEGNAKFPHQLAILAGEVKWELRCATEEEAENWIKLLPCPNPQDEFAASGEDDDEDDDGFGVDSPCSMPDTITVNVEDFQRMQAQLRQGQEAVMELGKEADEFEIGRGNESTDDEEVPAAELFDIADKNKDGVLTHSELKNFAQTAAGSKLKDVFDVANAGWAAVWQKVDTDNDGNISREEFISAYTQHRHTRAPQISGETKALRRKLAAAQKENLELNQSQNGLMSKLTEADARAFDAVERADVAEKQVLRLTEQLIESSNETCNSEEELAKKIKMLEGDLKIQAEAFSSQLNSLSAELELAKTNAASPEADSAHAATNAALAGCRVELQAAQQELAVAEQAAEQAVQDKNDQKSNYRMEFDTQIAQLQVVEAQLEGAREEQEGIERKMFESEEKCRLISLELKERQGDHEDAVRLAAELEQEKAEHANTKETLGREVGASSKIGKKKLDAAKMELTKVLSSLENQNTQLKESDAESERLKEEVQLLQVHTEQIMHAWNEEREKSKATGRSTIGSDLDERFHKMSQIQGDVSEQAEGLRERSFSSAENPTRHKRNASIAKDVTAFLDAQEYSTEKRALLAETEVEKLRQQITKLKDQLEMPSDERESMENMRKMAELRDAADQAKKEKGEAIAGMLLTESDCAKLRDEVELLNNHLSQVVLELNKAKSGKKGGLFKRK